MVNLYRVVEKQEKAKQELSKSNLCLTISLIFLGLIGIISFLFDLVIIISIIPAIFFIIALIVFFIKSFQLNSTNKEISKNIQRLFESTIKANLSEDGQVYAECYRQDSNYIYFEIDIYDENITSDDLECVIQSLTNEVCVVIKEGLHMTYNFIDTK